MSIADNGWVSLFNGKDLTGWKTFKPEYWAVTNGELVSRTPADGTRGVVLFTERDDYDGFHVRMEVKINKGGDSGLKFRRPSVEKHGYQAQIYLGPGNILTGSLFKTSEWTQPLVGVPEALVAPDTWFTLEVIAQGNHLLVKVDGKTVVDCIDATYSRGHLELVAGRPGTVVQFRRIEIKELPPSQTTTTPFAVAPFNAAKAKAHQDAWAKHLGVDVEITNSIGMKLRLIPPGEFNMGSSAAEIEWLVTQAPDLKNAENWVKELLRNEGPDRRVTIREPYLMGAHEVTVGQFRAFVQATNYKTEAEMTGGGFMWNAQVKKWERNPGNVWNSPNHSGSESHPVVFVTPVDARAFCVWLSAKEGRQYALPAEEQWEYACRAGTTTRWFFGDDPAAMKGHGWTYPHSKGKQPVGRLAANPFGLYDVYGNATEFTVTPQDQIFDRGGQSGESAQRARSAWRLPVEKVTETHAHRGFRVVVVGDLKAKTPAKAVAPFDAAKAKAHQDAWAKHLGVDVEITNSLNMKLRLIPPGEFQMGATDAEVDLLNPDNVLPEDWWFRRFIKDRLQSERPQHRVRLTQPFYLGAHEVTVAQFRQFVEAKKYQTDAERDARGGYGWRDGKWQRAREFNWHNPGFSQTDEHALGNVSWDDAIAFCRWLSERDKAVYRLPTEAEWEFACRAGTTTWYSSGERDESLQRVANLADAAHREQHPSFTWCRSWNDGHPFTAPVGRFQPNAFGLYDMHGNVWEWCADRFDAKYYGRSPEENPQGPPPPAPDEAPHVFRGGGWDNYPGFCRSADRYSSHSLTIRTVWAGFRVVREIEPPLQRKSPPAVPPPAAVAPFVIPARDAMAERKFATPAEAVAAAQSGDTIEIRGDGPFVVPTIEIAKNTALTIRAGVGSRPLLEMDLAGKKLFGGSFAMMKTDSPLVLEGLEFRWLEEEPLQEGLPWRHIIRSADAPLHVSHCRFITKNAASIIAPRLPLLEVRDCEFLGTATPIGCAPRSGGRINLDNCVGASDTALVFLHLWESPQQDGVLRDVSMRISRSTLLAPRAPAILSLYDRPRLDASGARPLPLQIEMENVLVDKGSAFALSLHPNYLKQHGPLPLSEAEALLGRVLDWKGRKNLYVAGPSYRFYYTASDTKKPFQAIQKEADWARWPGAADLESLSGPAQYQGGDLWKKLREAPQGVSAADFRLAEGSAGKAAGAGGKDVGADVDSVGPGAAYEKWRQTADYQTWLNATRQMSQ
jgi:sulfatase modifying factor 1